MNKENLIKEAIEEVLSFVYKCPECGKSSELKNPEDSLACPSCGFDVTKNTSFIDLPTDNLKIKVRPDDKREKKSSSNLEKLIKEAVDEVIPEDNFDKEGLLDLLADFEYALSDAKEKGDSLSDALHRNSETDIIAERMDSYILPHLKDWLEDEEQISSIPDLHKEIEKGEVD